MPIQLHPHELEFFIETNALVPAERALQVGYSLMAFLRRAENLGPDAEIRLSHLGQGSLVARIMAFLSHPATHGAAALVMVAHAGIDILKIGEGEFPEKIAEACIESNAQRCGFRVGKDVFLIERDEMPAIARVEERLLQGAPLSLPPAGYSYVMDGDSYVKSNSDYVITPDAQWMPPNRKYGAGQYGGDGIGGDNLPSMQANEDGVDHSVVEYLETEDGDPLLTEDGEKIELENRNAPNFGVDGIFGFVDGAPAIFGVERTYELRDFDPDQLPVEDRFMTFSLDGPVSENGETYRLRSWIDRHDGEVVVLIGRLVDRHDGRMVVFETERGTFTPYVPDDLLGWVPRGALVEVKGYIPDNDPRSLFILHWSEIEDVRDPNVKKLFDNDWAYEVRHPERLREVFGEPKENEFFAVGHIRQGPGAAFFDVEGGDQYRIENASAVQKILTGEVAAVLELRGAPIEDGPQMVHVVKYQTAPWNLMD